MLTPYDEFPVHQSPYPFSHIPSTDYSWDDGYFFGIFSPDDAVFLATGARVSANTDMVGGYAMLNVRGHQTTVRFNRTWRRNFELEIGPWRLQFIEPMKKIRLTLADNGSGLAFDLIWEGASPAFLEGHHVAVHRGRRTTDQSRYTQPGRVEGRISLGNQSWAVSPDRWKGSRDHSWGLYADRPPLSPPAALLPPRESSTAPVRAFRFWTMFDAGPFSGFYHMHETSEGVQTAMNDVFGTPFEGRIHRGWHGAVAHLKTGRHEIEFEPGSRLMKRARLFLTDSEGGEWRQEFEVASQPWIPQTIGYHPGSWKDGGTFITFHGSEELALEWDEFDFSKQPTRYSAYKVGAETAASSFGEGVLKGQEIFGSEYVTHFKTVAPDGTTAQGAAHAELFITGRYRPYGFE
jgi:hypothetical protein